MSANTRTIYLVPARALGRIATPVTHRQVLPKTQTCMPSTSHKRPCPTPVSVDPIEELLCESSGPHPPRKRERLNHLTAEEKLNRRKMKNRVAAQTARDRKKVRSQRLEDVVRELLDENQRLREENSRLRQEQQQREMAVESAAFINAPLPRVQVTSLLPLFLLCLSTSFRNKSSIASSKISKATLTSINSPVNCLAKKNSSKNRSMYRHPLRRPRLWSRIS